jgi:hypothetical protein
MAVNSSHPINALGAGLVLLMSPIPLFLGAVGAFAETGQMRLLFIVLFVCGVVLLFSGIRMIRQFLRAEQTEAAHQKAMREAAGPPPAAPGMPVQNPGPRKMPSGEPVLAHWTYEAGEWSAYTQGESKRKTTEAIVLGVAVFVVAWLIGGKGEEGETMRAAGAMVGIMLVAGGLLMARSGNQANRAGPGEAIISPSAILLNGEYHVLRNETYRFEGVSYDTHSRPPVLEFKVAWSTRHGPSSERVRIPVPAGREEEAREVVAAFERGWAVELPG